ncbi:MAG: cysteine synthase family protein [Bryobacterales bacterium]|nr:cysteine synthase family protein [Bryobacterales bacterium]
MPAPAAPSKNAGRNGVGLLDLIGNTPLIRLDALTRELPAVQLYGKAEFLNPGGSVKDRPAASMIRAAEGEGRLQPGQTIMDATSGNTGIAYAMLGAVRGYPVRLYLPSNASPERKRILAAYGAELVLTDPALQTDGAIQACRAAFAQDPEACFYPDQYGNPANWRAHYETTGPEIWRQTGGSVTHFVAGLGTSGTLMGTGRYLRERNPGVQLVSMQPASGFHGLEGLKHMATAMQPAIYDSSLADRDLFVDTEDAYEMVRRLAREAGLMVGISSGANVVAALRLALQARRGVIVTVLCDGADKYLSERFWEND